MGPVARYSTNAFKHVPAAIFGVVIANMWIFIKNEQTVWRQLLNTKNKRNVFHPLTGLWPLGTMHRFAHFVKMARDKLPTLFASYEKDGGEYHGPEDPIPTKKKATGRKRKKRKRALTLGDAIEEPEEDLEFVAQT